MKPALPPSIKRIINVAFQAPRMPGCPPWDMKWEGNSLHIKAINEALPYIKNANNTAFLISAGCVLESIDISASMEHLSASPTFLKNKIIIRFKKTTALPDGLYPALFERKIDTRPYKGGSIKGILFTDIIKESRLYPRTKLLFQSRVSLPFIEFVSKAEVHNNYLVEFPFSWFAKQKLKSRIATSAGLGCILVPLGESPSLITAGRLLLRIWCRLNTNGYSVQLLSAASLGVYDNAIQSTSKSLYSGGWFSFKNTFQFSGIWCPVILFRVGISVSSRPKVKGGRHALK